MGPTRSARVRIAAASEPACGSVRANAPSASPDCIAGSQRARCSSVPQVTTGYCDRMCTDSDTAIAMSAAPSSSMTSVQPRYENPAPPTAAGNGAAVSPNRAHRSEQGAVVALGLVAFDRARGHLPLGELASGRLEQSFLVRQRRAHAG